MKNNLVVCGSLLIAATLLASCGKSREEREVAEKAVQMQKQIDDQKQNASIKIPKLKGLLLDRLLDPQSANFRGLHIATTDAGEVLCGEVNSKNRMGGYVGFSPFIVSERDFTGSLSRYTPNGGVHIAYSTSDHYEIEILAMQRLGCAFK